MSTAPIRVSPLVGYELWAQSCDHDPNPIAALEKRTLASLLVPLRGKRFVEASCGTGRWLAYARERDACVTGFDLSPAMLAEAANKPGLPGRVAVADSRRLPVQNACADVVVSALSLAYMPPVETAVGELARLVAPGGRLFLSDFHPEASRAGWKRTFRRGAQVYEIENHPYSIPAMTQAALEAGLALERLLEPCFGEPERGIFLRCGKEELFKATRGARAILVAVFQRS